MRPRPDGYVGDLPESKGSGGLGGLDRDRHPRGPALPARRRQAHELRCARPGLRGDGPHDTKNGEQRTLPLAGKALDALRQLKLQNSARSEYLFPSPTVVFDPKSGKPQLDAPYEHFDAHWYTALDAAGISDFRFHDLCHTTASMLAAQGASLLEIADVLGHKTLAMVKRYSHLVVDHKAKVIEKMVAAKGL